MRARSPGTSCSSFDRSTNPPRDALQTARKQSQLQTPCSGSSRPRSQVKSFGVGRTVKLPGVSKSQPNTYPFGKPYADIHADLLSKDEELYTRNGLLAMVKRNMGVKTAPEKWQENTMCAGWPCAGSQLSCSRIAHGNLRCHMVSAEANGHLAGLKAELRAKSPSVL